jgi:branched-chain amino acid transport system substrate-binding protein
MKKTSSFGARSLRRARVPLIVGGVVLALALAGCSGAASSGGSTGSAVTVKVGLAVPLTGSLSAVGIQHQDGVNLAVKEANAANALGNGSTIEIEAQDTKADQAETIAVTQKLLSDGVTAVIGGTSTPEASVIKPRTAKEGVPFFLLASLDPTLNQPGVAYRAAPLPSSPGSADEQASQLLGKMKLKTAYIGNTVNNDGQKADAAAWTTYLGQNGINVLGTAGVNSGDTNFASQAAQVISAKPDLTVVSMLPGQDAGFVKALRDGGYTGTIASYASLSTPASFALAGETLTGTYVATIFQAQAQVTQTQDFVKAFEAEYNREPTYSNAIGFATAQLLIQGLKNSSSTADPAALAKATDAITSADTVYGPVKYENAQGYVNGELPMSVWKTGGVLAPWRS